MKNIKQNKKINILLISCYELGNQPIQTASLHAFLKSYSYSPKVLDLSTQKINPKEVQNCNFIAISTPMHTSLTIAVEATKIIRKVNKECHICFYGDYADLNSKYLLKNIADSCLSGETQKSILEIINSIETSSKEVTEKKNIYKNSIRLIEKPDFRTPERSLLPTLSNYNKLINDQTYITTAAVETSRGCKHQCLHCPITPIFKGRFFVVPKEIVLSDIKNLHSQGARHITFTDPDFLNGPKHSLRILREMNNLFPEMTFDFTAKVEHLINHKDIFTELRQLGCLFIVTALESLNSKILRKLVKGHSKKDFLEILKISRENEISIRPSLIAFTPWTTPKDYIELLNFIEENELIYEIDPIQMSIRLLIPPKSSLLKLKDIRKHIVDFQPERFSHIWKHPNPKMEILNSNISAVVEKHATLNKDALETFIAIKKEFSEIFPKLANIQNVTIRTKRVTVKPPKLTESWFC